MSGLPVTGQTAREDVNPRRYAGRWALVSGSESWILKGICREIERYGRLDARHFPDGRRLPEFDYYFFAHVSRLIQFLDADGQGRGKRIVLFTHFEDNGKRRAEDVIAALREADKIVCLSSSWKEWLVERGLEAERVWVALGGANPAMFKYHERRGSTVGFVSRFYPRKSPERIREIVTSLPKCDFILLGPGWQEYPGFEELKSQTNFTYLDVDYARYPSIYARMDVLVSPSTVEGGPMPLIEAMMANVVPVASSTGFAPDIISHGENGFLFAVDAGTQTIVALIREALSLRTNVRQTVEHLTWERFANEVLSFATDDLCGP